MDNYIWVYQPKDYGLGNFVNITPVIRRLYLDSGEPVPVYFESDYVRDLYGNSPYIEGLKEKPTNDPFVSSSEINYEIPDWKYVFKERWPDQDVPLPIAPPIIPIAIILNGCANEAKRGFKDPGKGIYSHILQTINGRYHSIFVGSFEDLVNFGDCTEMVDAVCVDNISLAASLIAKADIVISNDTGLYHVAGAMKKRGFIMWKETNFEKNVSSNKNFFHSMLGKWEEDFDRWILTGSI